MGGAPGRCRAMVRSWQTSLRIDCLCLDVVPAAGRLGNVTWIVYFAISFLFVFVWFVNRIHVFNLDFTGNGNIILCTQFICSQLNFQCTNDGPKLLNQAFWNGRDDHRCGANDWACSQCSLMLEQRQYGTETWMSDAMQLFLNAVSSVFGYN